MLDRFTQQHLGEARDGRNGEDLVHLRLAQVAVDEDDLVPGLGQDDGEVRRRRGLALARDRARHLDHLHRRVEPEELDVRAQPTVDLDGELVGLADRDRTVVRRRLDRYDGQHRLVGDRLEVLGRAHRVVDVVDEERRPETRAAGR